MKKSIHKIHAQARLGVVGLGLGQRFVRALMEMADLDRLVVCDSDDKRIQAIRETYPGISSGYTSLADMLSSERLDAVILITPDHLHRVQSELCLAAGCHVLVTKPLATTLDDANAMLAAAMKANRIFHVAHEARFRSRVMALRDIIRSGRIGTVIHVRLDSIYDKRAQFASSPWYSAVETGRTPMVGTGIHEVDLMRTLVGRTVTSVAAFSNHLGPLAFPTDTTIAALFRFDNGCVGQVTTSYEAREGSPGEGGLTPGEDAFRLIGTRGMVVGRLVSTDDSPGWSTLPDDLDPMQTGIEGCVREFLKALAGQANSGVEARDALASLALCASADQAAASGMVLKI